MTKSIVIFENIDECIKLFNVFKEKSVMLSEAILIPPLSEKISSDYTDLLNSKSNISFKFQKFEDIRILNPKLDRKIRQKDMSKWLMPFGFIAGIAFSNMTNLSTFSFLGLNNIGESLIGGLLGMSSGYLGSIVSSASININRNKELRSIIKFNKEGKWLILLENQIGTELPWALIKQTEAKDIIFLEG
ncbi:hypothetical protein [uncultured Prochlorococcus sp.]|uniref:hypothetical protein n=1 Tax=uncultured Prochlorococcus sp. TaxID=159733 RepID=UPI0025855A38|nr:hypothetical protein [uncultured Prochlorococcus sp.]